MKKQVKIIIGIVVAAAILIIGISFFYPTVFKGVTSGTFGKADKYHKQQMTEKDILLRSDLVSDTAQLRNMIQGLIYFSIFTQGMSKSIDSCVTAYKAQGMGANEKDAAGINVLQDYSDFIRNNNKTMATTISMLTCFYLSDTVDQSQDVEKNMRDFGNYVNNLSEKDSVLNQALVSMDKFLLTSKTMKAKPAEIASLKSIRDQLLIKGIQLSGLLQDKPLCSQLLCYALSSQSEYNSINMPIQGYVVGAQSKLQSIANTDKLQKAIQSNEMGFGSSQQFGVIVQGQQSVQAVNSKGGEVNAATMIGSAVIYNGAMLQFLYGTPAQLSKIISASQMSAVLSGVDKLGNIQSVAILSLSFTRLPELAVDMKNGVQSVLQGSPVSASQLSMLQNSICAQQSVTAGFTANFVSAVNQLGKQQLGLFDK